MAGTSSFVISWPKNIKLSFVKPLPEDLDIYCSKCRLFMQNPHQTSCCGIHLCEDCHKMANAKLYRHTSKCPSCSSSQYNAFPDRAHRRRIKALEVHCIHCVKQCSWSGKLEELSAHLNYREKKDLYRRYEGCSYTEIRCKHDSCFSFFYHERRLLKAHEDNCKHRPATCAYCYIFKGTFEKVEDHHKTCGMFPVPCTNKDHQDFTIRRKNLQHHLDTDCPFQPIDCQFKWAGCNDRPKRKDERQHNAASLQDHLLLLAGACSQLKKDNEDLREQLNQLTKARVEKLDHTVHGDLPVTGDENNPVHVKADGQPVPFFSDNYKYKMSVKFGKVRSATHFFTSYNIEFKVYRGNHKVIPDVKRIVIKSDRGKQVVLREGDLVKDPSKDNEKQRIHATIPDIYREVIYIIKVS
ncbi:PREDICTED: TNF receptor-associated factor 5-like [Amphimedon queenslandica]|uniref:TRAF-type domain-containing protein n=1 Tax=Amphimedon queenslandica TaxID=400682 RepID=A0AAN0ISV8_AMPQE|nr:PREDICTED: TNF receptor-associated factor 5-like [Amphimedon queenslandica]|eukprot:XP_011408422.2 PREDICTED: TNF receptor-associated factor 5-like [Amphimedon queenslandica]